ncbi:acyltransferase [Viridibacillus arvi]|uniref:acyltransferase n=1 Tax=Viridibacillus arvi TaxID=263475 RepID=UPI0034CF2B4C
MERNHFVDFLKGISIIGVFIIHTLALALSKEHVSIIGLYIDSLFRFAVPFFFGVLGYMTFTRYQHINDWKKFYKNKAIMVVLPYLLWSLLYFNVPTIYPFLEKTTGKETVWDILLGYSEIHLYFMVPYITFILLTPIVVKFIKKFHPKVVSKVCVILTSLFVLLLVFAENKYMNGQYSFFHETDYLFIYHWIGYYCIGMFIGINTQAIAILVGNIQKVKTRTIILVLVVYLAVVGIFTITAKVITPYATPNLVLNALVALWLLTLIYGKTYYKKITLLINKLGSNTFPFYLSHILFIKIGFLLLCSKDVTLISLLLVSLFAFVLSIGYILVHKKIVQFCMKNKH